MHTYITYISFSKLHINSLVLAVWYLYKIFFGSSFQWHSKGCLFLCRKNILDILRERNICTLNIEVCSWWPYDSSLTMFWSSATCVKIEGCAWVSPKPLSTPRTCCWSTFPCRQPFWRWCPLASCYGTAWPGYELLVQICGAALEALSEKALLFSLIWPVGFMKEWQKLPLRTESNTAAHWLLFLGGADEAFHSELSPLRGHVVLPYSLQHLLQEKCVASACPGFPEPRCTWQWMHNKSDM